MRARARGRGHLIAGINITPFTDVVLVLLVIFMVATPILIRSEIKVTLPKAAAAETAAERSREVTIDAAGAVWLDGVKVSLAELKAALAASMAKSPSTPVILKGDKDVRLDVVVQVLEAARSSGVTRLSLAVQVRK